MYKVVLQLLGFTSLCIVPEFEHVAQHWNKEGSLHVHHNVTFVGSVSGKDYPLFYFFVYCYSGTSLEYFWSVSCCWSSGDRIMWSNGVDRKHSSTMMILWLLILAFLIADITDCTQHSARIVSICVRTWGVQILILWQTPCRSLNYTGVRCHLWLSHISVWLYLTTSWLEDSFTFRIYKYFEY